MFDDALIDRIGDDQHQIGHGLGETGADHVGVQQAEREDQVLAGDAMGVSEKLTGVDNDSQTQPGGVRSGAVVACEAAEEPGQQGIEQPRLGDLRAEQHQDAIAVLGLLDMLWIKPRRCHGVAEDAVQACPHPSSRRIGSL
jgi:hypothetical protein